MNRAEQLIEGAPNLGDLIKSKEMSLRRKLKSKSILSLSYFKDDSHFGKIYLLTFFIILLSLFSDKIPCWKRKFIDD